MFNSPFSEAALAASANRRQQLDHLLRVTAPHERIVLAAIAVVLASLGMWTLFGSIAREIVLDGVLIAPGERHEVVATEPGYLTEFLVVPGDRVEPGAAIARQSVPDLQREAEVLRDRVASLEPAIGRTGRDAEAAASLLATARVALLQMEAQRAAREIIVSQIGGEVMALRSGPGEYLPAGAAVAQLRAAEDGPLQVTLQVAPHVAQRLRPGMPASVEVQMPNAVARRLEGVVSDVAAGPPPDWLAALQPAVADPAQQVDIELRQEPDLSLPDGTPCRIRIVLGHHPPAALLGFGRS